MDHDEDPVIFHALCARLLWLASASVVILLLFSFASHAELSEEEPEKADYLSLSALLIKGGSYDKAETVLAKVDLNDRSLDKKRYYTLSGIISLNKSLYAKSIEAFNKAIEAGQKNNMIHVYLAQAWMGLEEYKKAIAELDLTGELNKAMPGIWLLRSQALWKDGRKHAAWKVLRDAEEIFPGEKDFRRSKMFYAIELGLFQYAVNLGMDYIKDYEVSVNDYVLLADALRHGGQPEQALTFLELAHVRYPENKNVYLAMAQSYIDLDKLQAAASILQQGGFYHNILYKDAAELYKKAGMLNQALFVNSGINRQKEKLRQRLSLLLANENYDQVLAMRSDLYRVHLLDEEDFIYALAYAHFKIGDFDRAEQYLEKIRDARLFRRATELRKVMTSCADERWRC